MHRTCVAAIMGSLVCLAFPHELIGQRVRMGFRTGLNFATWGGADVNDFEAAIGGSVTTRTGVTAGGLVSFPLGGPISIEPELLFISKGAKIEVGGNSATLSMGYFEVPVLLVIAPRVQGSIRPALIAGGAFALRLSCSVSGGGTSDSCSSQSLDTKSTDYGVVFGGQLGFGMGPRELQIDIRYNLGLGSVFDASPSIAINNRGLTLTAAYLFRSGR